MLSLYVTIRISIRFCPVGSLGNYIWHLLAAFRDGCMVAHDNPLVTPTTTP
ncbi:MAG TPA: hypothetical protein VN380_17120 [Thermoanaerobaculia bacterium]|nr:hypothetical protein [Thermoanaerobaculia bacterium]